MLCFAQSTGLPWARYIVAVGALAGILTGPLVGFYAGARIICILGRQRLIPPVFARINPRFGTPIVATAVQGIAVCAPPAHAMEVVHATF
jgi:APA family basic amino acid/polyamine antiporter